MIQLAREEMSMSSDQPKIVFNTRERALSDDQNLLVQLSDRSLQEALRHALGEGSRYSGVIQGFECSIGAAMAVNVSAGLALLRDSGKTFPDSEQRWIELLAADSVTIDDGDATSPRWDVIELAPGTSVSSSTPRDIFQQSLGTFTTVTVTKQETSTPSITVRKGTPAATPAMPNGIADRIPLAYVLVPANETDLGTNAPNNIVLCRPILRQVGPEFYEGGGVNDNGVSATAADVLRLLARRPDSPLTMSVAGGVISFATIALADHVSSTETWPPSTDDAIQVYAAPPPYPTGYDSNLAPREYDAKAALSDTIATNTKNCILFVTNAHPKNVSDKYNPQGEPNISDFSMNDATWGTGTVDASESVYCGSIRVTSTGNALDQTAKGAEVILQESLPTENDVQNNSDSTTTTGNLRREQPLTPAGDTVLPESAYGFRCIIGVLLASTAVSTVTLTEKAGGIGEAVWLNFNPNAGANEQITHVFWINAEDGTLDWRHQEAGVVNSIFSLTVAGYRDAVLASR